MIGVTFLAIFALFGKAIDFGIISPKNKVKNKGTPTFKSHPERVPKRLETVFCIRILERTLIIKIVTRSSLGFSNTREINLFLLSTSNLYVLRVNEERENKEVSDAEKKAEEKIRHIKTIIKITLIMKTLVLI